ncbi:MAG: hypothetical protein ACRDZ5_10295, partial [Acidimicrobiales bacterium]
MTITICWTGEAELSHGRHHDMAGTSLSQQPAGLRTLAAGPVLACAAILAALPLGPSTAASGHSGAAGGSARVPASFRRAAGNAAGSTARPRASYVGAAEARLAAVPGQGLGATDALPRPSWWHGSCDGGQGGAYPGSRPNSARFDGLVSCGPGRNQGGEDHLVQFYPGAWGEYEWECVELSMRFMLEAWGVPPYPADGNDVVA